MFDFLTSRFTGLLENPLDFIFYVLAILSAITIHEFFHAFSADRMGDPTPRVQGRLTLNPLKHLDPLGTLALLFVGFGWGKPVQFDPYNLANPRRDAAIISFAGPASNLVMAVVFSIVGRAVVGTSLLPPDVFFYILPFIYINVILAVFNLLPIHPLDGGKVLVGLLPEDLASSWNRILSQYGTVILLLLILPLFGQPLVFKILGPTIALLLSFLMPTANLFGLI